MEDTIQPVTKEWAPFYIHVQITFCVTVGFVEVLQKFCKH